MPWLLSCLIYRFEYHKTCFSEEDNSTVVLPCMKALEKKKLIQKCLNAFLPPDNLNKVQRNSPRVIPTLISCIMNLRLPVQLDSLSKMILLTAVTVNPSVAAKHFQHLEGWA